ncbi:MAG TPA: 16S rRNA (adenine(1518)-N(6)/adenine(1519)-N(6))-dimethyltransferase RsmA [Candidatus Acidoferrales bacterium]|nr:16S rRNA (adenine(1518)-N(6)/adenine(1519)-N(6))-dimethyltransferase RsmA [Candidatus Acidoferrales bacterium]
MPGTRLGQNFLATAAWREKIAASLEIRRDQTWLEIGAGHGEMTEHLAARASRVVSIELDPKLASDLRDRAESWPNVTLIESDVLKLDLANVAGPAHFHIYGSIPYYITSPILHLLFTQAQQIDSAHLVMQLEVAQRLVAKPGSRDCGYLSVATQFHFTPKIAMRIPPGAFRPAPKVTSALVELRPPGAALEISIAPNSADANRFLEFVGTCFAHKRKTLLNNLKSLPEFASGQTGKLQEILRRAQVPPNSRAEQLTIAQFARLFRGLPT